MVRKERLEPTILYESPPSWEKLRCIAVEIRVVNCMIFSVATILFTVCEIIGFFPFVTYQFFLLGSSSCVEFDFTLHICTCFLEPTTLNIFHTHLHRSVYALRATRIPKAKMLWDKRNNRLGHTKKRLYRPNL